MVVNLDPQLEEIWKQASRPSVKELLDWAN